MRPIVYLASYPRSGNTFLRALLANALAESGPPLGPREIAHFGAGEKHEALWRACTGLDWLGRTIEIEWRARQAYLEGVRSRPGEGPIFLKTHTLNGVVFDRPAFFFEPVDRIVYIVRHPLDVLVSASHFFRIAQPAMADRMLTSGAFNTSAERYFEITGSWTEHIGGWVTETRCPILIVRFEDLCAQPGQELRRVLAFSGERVSEDSLARAVASAAFETLQAAHAKDGFDQGPGRAPHDTFFRSGRVGQWREALPPDLSARMSAELGPFMDTFGYEKADAAGARDAWPQDGLSLMG